VIPELLGGPETLMIGRVLWDEFFSNNDWPMASTRGGGDGAADHRAAGDLQQVPGRGAGAHAMRGTSARLQPLVRPRLAVAGLCVPVPAHRRAGHLLVQRLAAAQRVARLHAEVVRALASDGEMLWPACGSA
jgi:hypothetical protein